MRRRGLSRLAIPVLVTCILLYVWRATRMALQVVPPSPSQTLGARLRDSFASTPHEASSLTNTNHTYDGTISACLLVMDDNHFLIEWLAYHYFVLPLGHLIVAVDPRSRTHPQAILGRWRNEFIIDLWKDDDFSSAGEQREAETHVKLTFGKELQHTQPDLIVHRARQRLFYYKCMKHLKEIGKDWVLLTDTDEFMHVNYPTTTTLGLNAPSMDQRGSVMTFLEKERLRPDHNLSSPCIQIPRIRYGAVESDWTEIRRHVPAGFNASQFLTLRWRKHANPENHYQNKISKTLLDLSRIDWDMLVPVDSIHRPVRMFCGHRRLYIQSQDQVFLINHYLGTWEQYSYRNDSRMGVERSVKVR